MPVTSTCPTTTPEAASRPSWCPTPLGGVKEQTAGLYAERLAAEGFATLAFDASYQGEGEGTPRFLENPFARAEDVKSAVTFLTTRDEVDPERLGALGICASGGYVSYAAQTEHRIKAVATVSGADIGGMFREGLGGGQSEDVLRATLYQAGKDRTSEACGAEPCLQRIAPETEEEAPNAPGLFQEAYEYYRTPAPSTPTRPIGCSPAASTRSSGTPPTTSSASSRRARC
ncbi:alpha/beta hydrolase [Streptomyces sanglieri]|uniref:alpha/beta hydrolase n=1 Tax=Streptomyces sanglieri TaxID=193460 RepID=UPI0035269E9D